MKQIAFFLMFALILSCKNKQTEEDFYVIEKQTKSVDSLKMEHPFYYGDHNFILADSTKIYYHNKNVFYWCGTGIDFTKPPKLYLFPDSLIEIKKDNLEYFLKQKLSTQKKSSHSAKILISISSPTDTIRNNALGIIRSYLKPIKKVLIGIRRCTEEEEYVALAKLQNKSYNPKDVKWKIGFDHEEPTLKEVIKFIPPVEE